MSDKADVAVSYDVDNEFFRLWLDRRMNYTGAVFGHADDLEAAQRAKLAVLYRFGKVSAASRVLDIGCGWGANLEYLTVDRGVRDRAPRQAADIREVGWVSREIFLGGITPRMEDIVMAVSPYWEILETRTRREDYRRTCEHWRRRLRGPNGRSGSAGAASSTSTTTGT